jgi:chemotaxis signal transduction protein
MTASGHVTFEVRGAGFAVAVADVKEVLRVAEVRLLPSSDRTVAGRALTLVDSGGRSLPALDLRADRDGPGDVLVARAEGRAGLVVDTVSAVLRAGELVAEPVAERALPSYAVGVVRPAGGGEPRLLVSLPEVARALAPGEPGAGLPHEPPLGDPVLHSVLA